MVAEGRFVSFSSDTRKVLDTSLPLKHRVNALRGCLRRYRSPHPSAPNPNQPSHWYGAPREAALHAVWVWYSKGVSADIDVHSLAVALLERGRFTAAQREIFERVLAEPGDSRTIVRQMAVVVAHA